MTVKDGSQFDGVFHACSMDDNAGVVLKCAKKVDDPAVPYLRNTGQLIPTLIIQNRDFMSLTAAHAELESTTAANEKAMAKSRRGASTGLL